MHPYEGPKTALGTASVGMEFIDQVAAAGVTLDAVIVAAGGGGLTGGVACAVKQMSPSTAVYVVEPEGADSLSRSFKAGSPQAIEAVRTIADSLGAPRCEPYSFALNQQFVDEVVLVDDDQIREAMRLTFRAAKLAVEPAGAAALAALMYPLRARLDGQAVGLVVCGANIDPETFTKQIALGPRWRRWLVASNCPMVGSRSLNDASRYWQVLDPAERQRLAELADFIVANKRWEAARGFDMTDEVVVTIAVQAAVLILGLDTGYFGKVTSIIVHPTTFSIPGPRPTPSAGWSMRARVLCSARLTTTVARCCWPGTKSRSGARHRGRGRNVVLHEFAHKMDMLDGVVDGTPLMPDQQALDRWIAVCAAELESMRRGEAGPLLDDYGATDPGEFFAVATEVFFGRPWTSARSSPSCTKYWPILPAGSRSPRATPDRQLTIARAIWAPTFVHRPSWSRSLAPRSAAEQRR